MNDTSATGNFYTIGHLTQITNLSERTIRNYLSTNILSGEKINGVWHFSPEEVNAFLEHPAVYPSIQAKNNAIIYDFMLNQKKENHQCCIILDLPGEDRKTVSEFFCYEINHGTYQKLRFALYAIKNEPRVILSGNTEEILSLVHKYYESKKT